MSTVTFITGNQHKADYLAKLLGTQVDHQKVDLDEIQSDNLEKIVEHKVRQAYAVVGASVLVDDVALGFAALGGLPGPFIKYFVEQPDGLEKLCRMLDGFNDRSARALCTMGYYDGERLRLFSSGLNGSVSDHPRGEGGFGWDKVFCPEGYNGKTRAELILEEDEKTYRSIKPIAEVREFLATLD